MALQSILQHVTSPEDASRNIEAALKAQGKWTESMQEALPVMMSNDGKRKYAVSKKYPEDCRKIEELWWQQNMPTLYQRAASSLGQRTVTIVEAGILIAITLIFLLTFVNLS